VGLETKRGNSAVQMSAEEALITLINHEPAYLKVLGWLIPIVVAGLVFLMLYYIVKLLRTKPDEKNKSGCSMCR
jgi:hypothetical protein